MAALKGIAEGKHVSDTVSVQPYGTSTKIFTALSDAAKHLDEPFADDDLALVDQANERVGLKRIDNKKNDIALAILRAFVPPKKA